LRRQQASGSVIAGAISVYGERGIAVAIAVMTFILVIFGELLPKTVAAHNPSLIFRIALPMRFFVKVLSPVVAASDAAVALLLSALQRRRSADLAAATEDELLTAVDMGTGEGGFDEFEQQLIRNIFALGDTPLTDVMVPRTEIFSISRDLPWDEACRRVGDADVKYVPVYDGEPDNIVGVITAGAMAIANLAGTGRSIADVIRPPGFVPGIQKVKTLLDRMRRTGDRAAFVLDEYGALSGLVTLEDLIDELTGEIINPDHYRRLKQGIITVDAKMELGDLNELIGSDFSSTSCRTVGGYLMGHAGRIPKRGESFEIGPLVFYIVAARPQAIDRVMVVRSQVREVPS